MVQNTNYNIKATQVAAYAESVNIGDVVSVVSRKNRTKDLKEVLSDVTTRHTAKVRIKEKYKHIAIMDNGESFTWTEIFIWNVLGDKAGEKL